MNPFKGELTIAKLASAFLETCRARTRLVQLFADCSTSHYKPRLPSVRTWKRLAALRRNEILLLRFATKATTKLTDIAQDIFPMWKGDRIYFVSELRRNPKPSGEPLRI